MCDKFMHDLNMVSLKVKENKLQFNEVLELMIAI